MINSLVNAIGEFMLKLGRADEELPHGEKAIEQEDGALRRADGPLPPRWLVVANIVESRVWGPGGTERRRGVRQFGPGAKVVVVKLWRNASPRKVTVVGHQRASKRYATVMLDTSTLFNLRVQLIRSPHILRQLDVYAPQPQGYGVGGQATAENVLQFLCPYASATRTDSADK